MPFGFGERIKDARGDLSQQRLGELVGSSQSTINDWEHERSTPPLDKFQKIAEVTGRSAAWLAFGDTMDGAPATVDREILRLAMVAIDRRIARKMLARASAESRATMALALHDLVRQNRTANRSISEQIERQLDALIAAS